MQQCSETQTTPSLPSLPMGWALKPSQSSRTRFTEKQKDYLLSKFLIGVQTGQKVDATSVSRSMVSARDANGVKLFNSTEFLTGQQVASYFSRLASKRRIQGCDTRTQSYQGADEESLEAEAAFSELREEIVLNIQPAHPIMYDSYNLCELTNEGKLSKFAISMLDRVCIQFEIPTSDIKGRRKAPYLSRIEEFLKKCKCCNS